MSSAQELHAKIGNQYGEFPQIILVILPSKTHYLYLPIKHIYDTGKNLKNGWGVQSQMLSACNIPQVVLILNLAKT